MNMYESTTYQAQSAVSPSDSYRFLKVPSLNVDDGAADTWAAFKVYLTQSPPRNSIACKLSQGFLCQELILTTTYREFLC